MVAALLPYKLNKSTVMIKKVITFSYKEYKTETISTAIIKWYLFHTILIWSKQVDCNLPFRDTPTIL